MALLESEIPDTAQHYLVCGIGDCERNCLFYCNPCHQPMCEQCKDKHQKSPETKNHEVVPYRDRKHKLPMEKCRDHPTRNIDILCDECNVPLCSKCSTMPAHKGHSFTDLETIYTEKSIACRQEVQNIQAYFMPTAKDLQSKIKLDATEIKTIMDGIRSSMRDEAKSLKTLVDEVTSDNIEQLNKMEESLRDILQNQEKTYQEYISYLEDLVKKFHDYLSSTQLQNNPIISPLSEHFKIRPIPETTKPVPPEFTAGRYTKGDVAKLMGRITILDTKAENRKIKPTETSSTQLQPTGKHWKQEREKSDVKQTLSLSSSVTKVREYTVPGVDRVFHVSLGRSGRLWVSDDDGNLVQTDLQGNHILNIQTKGYRNEGYHTVTKDGDLIYTDKHNNIINRITLDNTITEIIKTGDWTPISIHSSHINEDILVGMDTDKEAKVTRYNKTGKEIQNIQRDNKGQELFEGPLYITENINGDICTSDIYRDSVVVVNKSGQHRFSYTGQGSKFYPKGVCTDPLRHILVCDYYSHTVHLLDQDGQFLCLLLAHQVERRPSSLCVDDENNLIVGQYGTNTVTVYKYLQR
ncbi:tripartite motif-containing protein 2-like [Crassostrea angulata]|uniref:tripartite motif-containing protein 2-like n=1 Tax=Magallana angulata TaxID=2784310 RepID=UPI0022B20DDF|nr:tripartite motif-containing protein 2-like [Crassostrea angulata]